MGEPLRIFALAQVQQAEHRVFEGPKYQPWENPYRHSLPPPPDPPKKVVTRPKISSTPMASRSNLALVTTPEGKRRWELSPELAAEAERRICAGEKVYRIAKIMGVSTSTIGRLAKDLHQQLEATPDNQTRQQSVMVALPAPAPAPATACCTSIAVAARFAFEVPTLPPRITHTTRVSTEPRSGTHVLDWQHRMARLEFEGQPGKGKPKRSRKGLHKGCTHQQVNSVIRSNHRPVVAACINPVHSNAPDRSHAINCAAPTPKPLSPFD